MLLAVNLKAVNTYKTSVKAYRHITHYIWKLKDRSQRSLFHKQIQTGPIHSKDVHLAQLLSRINPCTHILPQLSAASVPEAGRNSVMPLSHGLLWGVISAKTLPWARDLGYWNYVWMVSHGSNFL